MFPDRQDMDIPLKQYPILVCTTSALFNVALVNERVSGEMKLMHVYILHIHFTFTKVLLVYVCISTYTIH